ncbi:MAG: chromosomal replication initiator protein DnaA [Kofleriaceae bacterium]|nr:chromosomal replication initiator protein DnaA [Kofleriaceae bacterium]
MIELNVEHGSRNDGLWSSALERLRTRISPQNFDMWLSPIECLETSSSKLVLRAPNSYVRLWFESNFLPTVLGEIQTISGTSFAVEFAPDLPIIEHVRAESSNSAIAVPTVTGHDNPDRPDRASEPPQRPSTISPSGEQREFTLNPRYTFDAFVAGPSNQLAFAASQASASSYPPKYNPVFLCGSAGLGKTHLLHAIGHQQLLNRPGARILYLSSERFMNEYVQAIRLGQMHEFRKRYREGIDVLLVDDVQFLAGKDGTQEEFFHTFNALHDAHRQIVLTADRKPHEIPDIADRLKTRFAWGLLADIEPPELEVRLAILRQKAATEQVELPDDVGLYIATAIRSNVRELEGALIRLAAYASLAKRRIDLEFAQQTLGAAISRPLEIITVDAVIRVVANYYNLKPADIKSQRRHKSLAAPRAVAMYLARQHTKDSYPDLGRGFGGKHHTTVISAVEKVASRLRDDAALRSEIHAIESSLLR